MCVVVLWDSHDCLSDSPVLTHPDAAFLLRDLKELLRFIFVCSVEKINEKRKAKTNKINNM